MKKLNDTKACMSYENFITTSSENGGIYFRLPEHFTKNIEDRRKNQYIAGDIITIISDSDLNAIAKGKFVDHLDSRIAYFLVMSNSIGTDYLICPLTLKSPVYSFKLEIYEVYLGVIEEVSKYKFAYADLSKCVYVENKNLFCKVKNTKNLLELYGYNNKDISVSSQSLKKVIKRYKNLI